MSLQQRTEGQAWVSQRFAELAAGTDIRVDEADWHQTSQGLRMCFQLFVVYANGKTFNTQFDDDNLEDSPATPEIRALLDSQVKELVQRIQAGDDGR